MSLTAILWKDARREIRSKESLQAGLVLVGLFFILYLFALSDLQDDRLATIAMWTPILYGTAALAGRGLASEVDRGTLALVQTAPVAAAMHGWSRTLINLVLTGVLAAFSLLLGAAGFLLPLSPGIWLTAGLGVIGLAIIGTLAGALASQARAREVLMPILLIPIAAPLLQSGVAATLDILGGGDGRAGLLLMAGYDIIAFGAAWFLWPFALEAD